MYRSTNLDPLDFCEKSIRCHYSSVGSQVSMKFAKLVQNNMPVMNVWSILKPTVEFHDGRR